MLSGDFSEAPLGTTKGVWDLPEEDLDEVHWEMLRQLLVAHGIKEALAAETCRRVKERQLASSS